MKEAVFAVSGSMLISTQHSGITSKNSFHSYESVCLHFSPGGNEWFSLPVHLLLSSIVFFFFSFSFIKKNNVTARHQQLEYVVLCCVMFFIFSSPVLLFLFLSAAQMSLFAPAP